MELIQLEDPEVEALEGEYEEAPFVSTVIDSLRADMIPLYLDMISQDTLSYQQPSDILFYLQNKDPPYIPVLGTRTGTGTGTGNTGTSNVTRSVLNTMLPNKDVRGAGDAGAGDAGDASNGDASNGDTGAGDTGAGNDIGDSSSTITLPRQTRTLKLLFAKGPTEVETVPPGSTVPFGRVVLYTDEPLRSTAYSSQWTALNRYPKRTSFLVDTAQNMTA